MALPTLEDVRAWDRDDPLRPMRARFALPGGVIYLDGNSLGALPRETAGHLERLVREAWGERLIRSWGEGWLEAPARIGDKIARLVGAAPGEVVVADSTSINLFKLIVAALRLRPGRSVILKEAGDFPTDAHCADGAARCVPGSRVRAVAATEIAASLDEDVAVLVLTHVNYRSGLRHDMAGVTRAAHEAGALVLWDLSHSTGAVPVELGACDADLAVGCGYKFLNGGPGAPAFLFVATPLQAAITSPLQGWMGHAAPFAFDEAWRQADGMARFLVGTPPILSLLALESGVDLWLGVDQAAVFAKSHRLFALFDALISAWCPSLELVTPRQDDRRGSHIAFAHQQAEPIMQALIARGVIGDYRPPGMLRFGLTPLYLGYEDVWRAARILAEIIAERADRAIAAGTAAR
jgi:kynureninase